MIFNFWFGCLWIGVVVLDCLVRAVFTCCGCLICLVVFDLDYL